MLDTAYAFNFLLKSSTWFWFWACAIRIRNFQFSFEIFIPLVYCRCTPHNGGWIAFNFLLKSSLNIYGEPTQPEGAPLSIFFWNLPGSHGYDVYILEKSNFQFSFEIFSGTMNGVKPGVTSFQFSFEIFTVFGGLRRFKNLYNAFNFLLKSSLKSIVAIVKIVLGAFNFLLKSSCPVCGAVFSSANGWKLSIFFWNLLNS